MSYGGYYQPGPQMPQPHAHQHDAPGLSFYGGDQAGFYGGGGAGSSHVDGNMGTLSGSISSTGNGAVGAGPQGWLAAFGTGGFEGEPPLLEELGINFAHIQSKTLTVLNPLRTVDEHIMDDADLYGPLIFYFLLGVCLLLSGKPQFGYIYGLALLGSLSTYFLFNLMSPNGIDAHRVASVLGYCLLPMVVMSAINIGFGLDHTIGYFLAALSVGWCTFSASGIFAAVLRTADQRLLLAYPISLLYSCFALLMIFAAGGK